MNLTALILGLGTLGVGIALKHIPEEYLAKIPIIINEDVTENGEES